MTTNYKDPKSYVDSLVTKRGKSGPDGVYLTNLTVVAEAESDYGYKVNFAGCSSNTPPSDVEYGDWLDLLVQLREDNPQTPQSVHATGEVYQFIPEGGYISLNVFVPSLDLQMFEYFVSSSQYALNYVAKFAGKIPTHIRFSIGYATSKWGDLVDSGYVTEDSSPWDDWDIGD